MIRAALPQKYVDNYMQQTNIKSCKERRGSNVLKFFHLIIFMDVQN
jgi:hypothetical protein